MREDFEIYQFIRNDHQWYGFKVEYFGIYAAPSKELILKKREEIRKAVKRRLAWVEKENQKYYARLVKEENERAILFRKNKKRI